MTEKTKTTLYLSSIETRMVNEIYCQKLLSGRKEDKSSIIREAIRLLYDKEKSRSQENQGKDIITPLNNEGDSLSQDVDLMTLEAEAEISFTSLNSFQTIESISPSQVCGILFEKNQDYRSNILHGFKIVPEFGEELSADFDENDFIYIRVGDKQKILATTFIRVLGYSTNSDILEEFFCTRKVKIKSEKEFAKFVGKILARDVVDEERGLVLAKAAEKLTAAMLKRMVDAGINLINITEDADESTPIIKMLSKDTTNSYEAALKEFYKKICPDQSGGLAEARSEFVRIFHNPRYYNLGCKGRSALNNKLGVVFDDEVLHKEDIIQSIKLLMRQKMEKPFIE